MEIPADIAITCSLEEGAVFLYDDDEFPEKKHYFVLLNKNPIADIKLVLVNATSQVVKKMNYINICNINPNTLVLCSPSELSFLKTQSVFNCNSPKIRTKEVLINKLNGGSLKLIGVVGSSILNKLRTGITLSRGVSPEIKRLVS